MDALFYPHSNAAPARHNIESDSDSDFSDPEAGDVRAHASSRKENKKQPCVIEFKGSKQPQPRGHCIVALGQAGQLWTGGLKSEPNEDVLVLLNEETIGSSTAASHDTTLLCLHTAHLNLSAFNKIASAILDKLQPSSLQIIDAYEPDLYLPEPSMNPPVRLLQSALSPSTSKVQPFEIPNLITGLAAALAAHAERQGLASQTYLLPMAKARRPAGFYDPSSAANASEADPVALAALQSAPTIPEWRSLDWSAKRATQGVKRWSWLQKAERERSRRIRDEEDQMYM